MSALHLLIQGKNSEEDNNKVLSFLLIVIDYLWVNKKNSTAAIRIIVSLDQGN